MEHDLRNSEVRTELAHLVLDCTSMREFGIETQMFSAPVLSLHPSKDGEFIPLSRCLGNALCTGVHLQHLCFVLTMPVHLVCTGKLTLLGTHD